MPINKYKRKPTVVEAIQWDGNNLEEIEKFVGKHLDWWRFENPDKNVLNSSNNILKIETLEGDHMASIGDYIIKGVKGEFYPCKPDIFEKTYEIVEE